MVEETAGYLYLSPCLSEFMPYTVCFRNTRCRHAVSCLSPSGLAAKSGSWGRRRYSSKGYIRPDLIFRPMMVDGRPA